MKIIALIKTFRGDEFAEASLESVYPWVDNIIAVHSDVGWDGRRGNTVRPIYKQWAEANDAAGKIIQVAGKWKTQDEQYKTGFDVLTDAGWNVAGNVLMLFDSDEVWDAWELQQAIKIIESDNGNHPAYTSSMRVHIKRCEFIVDPPFGAPTCFVTLPTKQLCGCRGEATPHKRPLLDMGRNGQWIHMHHFTLVRRSIEDVRAKIAASFEGDGESRDQTPDVDRWMNDIWAAIPNIEDFHPFPRVRHVWHGMKTIAWDDLPEAVKKFPELREIEAK